MSFTPDSRLLESPPDCTELTGLSRHQEAADFRRSCASRHSRIARELRALSRSSPGSIVSKCGRTFSVIPAIRSTCRAPRCCIVIAAASQPGRWRAVWAAPGASPPRSAASNAPGSLAPALCLQECASCAPACADGCQMRRRFSPVPKPLMRFALSRSRNYHCLTSNERSTIARPMKTVPLRLS